MKSKLNDIICTFMSEISSADINTVEDIRVKYLGKKGEITAIMKTMGSLSSEERPVFGQLINEARDKIESALLSAKQELEKKELESKLLAETIDITLPGDKPKIGKKHPLTSVLDEIKDIFLGLGFNIEFGSEAEKTYYNFDALNIPKNHPARAESDTFYLSPDIVLRTQTSPVQIHTMENEKPPIRVISPGRVYRSDAVDATHSPVFHQIEGLVVDRGIKFSDLKGLLENFAKTLYGEDTIVRFRPHHFPFTEPSAEMDAQCHMCQGDGCRLCKGEGWIEILGCGMVHPNVLKACNINPDEFSGYAFGMGLERIVMRKYKIDDIRLFFENDVRFLNNF